MVVVSILRLVYILVDHIRIQEYRETICVVGRPSIRVLLQASGCTTAVNVDAPTERPGGRGGHAQEEVNTTNSRWLELSKSYGFLIRVYLYP